MVADHFIEADRVGAGGDRGEQAAGLDLPELRGVADQHQLGLGRLGVVDQAGEARGVHHPGLVDHQHRVRGKRFPAALPGGVKARQQAGDRGGVDPLGAQHVGRPPGRRRGHQLASPGLRPAAGRGGNGVGLAGARLADHHDEALAASEQAVDHLALIGLQRRTGVENPPGDDLADQAAVAGAGQLAGDPQRAALKLPDALGGVGGTAGSAGDLDHLLGGEEGVGELHDL